MQDPKVNGVFTSEKISKIRWVQEEYATPHRFLTGSWGFDKNYLRLMNIDEYFLEDNEYSPKCMTKLLFDGDISGLEWINFNNFAIASTEGFVSIVQLNRNIDKNNLTEVHKYSDLHSFSKTNPAPCTAVSIYDENLATVGEDGRLNLLGCNNNRIIRTIDDGDSISMTSVAFISYNEILSGNRMGTIKMFDIRCDSNEPQATLIISCQEKNSNCVNCISYHPTQKHIILGGSEEGSITVWDLRKPNFFASYFTAHNSGITELSFHQTQPNKVFSASDLGDLWLWNQNILQPPGFNLDGQKKIEEVDPWLNGERAKNKFNVVSLLSGVTKSINSFDTFDNKIICGCDNEAIYLIENIS